MDSTADSRPTNRLARETSPYLLQHARNPVDWYPWGEEALRRAKGEDKPIFLSIGYSACHWCHVMEHESFENAAIAEILNREFVCIKVDREERPDLDDIYMQAVQMLTGRGGWPMSVFLTPALKPFFGGTYFPPFDGPRGMGFATLATRLAEAYRLEHEKVLEGAEELGAALAADSSELALGGEEGISLSMLENATARLAREFDASYGGFGGAPKFPPSMALNLLLSEYRRRGEPQLLEMVEKTLEKMIHGGIYDHLLGGFHRYSTDHRWLVPHFEKMLYDNALMTIPLVDAYRVTRNEDYLRAARRTLDYILRDMTSDQGGFFSTEDADSEGEEGKFYVWDVDEVQKILGAEEAGFFVDYFGMTPHGNFEGKNILEATGPLDEFAKRRGAEPAAARERIAAASAKLEAVRDKRVHPGKDDKIITAWNGMMISAFTRAAQVTGEEKYATAAARAADFLLKQMRKKDGTLLRTWRNGDGRIDAFLEDYAHLAVGLIDLYETLWDPRWLEEAEKVAEVLIARFEDAANGGFFTSDGRDPNLIARRKEYYDGATPSGNSTAAHALLRLSVLLDRADYRERALRAMKSMHAYLTKLPGAAHNMLCAVARALEPAKEIAVIGDPASEAVRAAVRELQGAYLPWKTIACAATEKAGKGFNERIAPLKGKTGAAGGIAIYICQNYACQAPVGAAAEALRLLGVKG